MNSIRRWLHGLPLDQWSDTYAYRVKHLADGTCAKGRLMRRFVGGRWQYRRMDAEEVQSAREGEAW